MDIKSFVIGKNASDSGGYPEPTGTISITENGTGINVKDYAAANVNVPTPTPDLEDITITQNGVYNHPNKDGYDEVTVNVPNPSTGNINITDMNSTDVTNYATAQVVDADLVAGNIKKDVNILGVTGSYEGTTPTGTKQITANGTGIDVAQYAYADVAVPTSGPTDYVTHSTSGAYPETVYHDFDVYGGFDSQTVFTIGDIFDSYSLGYFPWHQINITVHPTTQTRIPNAFCRQSTPYNSTDTPVFVTIPNQITYIGSYAFYGKRMPFAINSQTSGIVNLPNQLHTLDNSAFNGCVGITTVYFNNTPISVNQYVFQSCSNLTDIYVPWSEGEVANAPWGATNATIHYDTV